MTYERDFNRAEYYEMDQMSKRLIEKTSDLRTRISENTQKASDFGWVAEGQQAINRDQIKLIAGYKTNEGDATIGPNGEKLSLGINRDNLYEECLRIRVRGSLRGVEFYFDYSPNSGIRKTAKVSNEEIETAIGFIATTLVETFERS